MEKHPLNLFLVKETDEPYNEPWRPGLIKFAKVITIILVFIIVVILAFS